MLSSLHRRRKHLTKSTKRQVEACVGIELLLESHVWPSGQLPKRSHGPPLPEVPDAPEVPEESEVPEVPEVPEAPVVPEALEVPEAPEVPDAVPVVATGVGNGGGGEGQTQLSFFESEHEQVNQRSSVAVFGQEQPGQVIPVKSPDLHAPWPLFNPWHQPHCAPLSMKSLQSAQVAMSLHVFGFAHEE